MKAARSAPRIPTISIPYVNSLHSQQSHHDRFGGNRCLQDGDVIRWKHNVIRERYMIPRTHQAHSLQQPVKPVKLHLMAEISQDFPDGVGRDNQFYIR